jgi:pilus assembly protein FimV
MLMMALAMPGASHALGLGDIHVDSALNERLAAQIDIVGASVDELDDLRAAVANRETFLRYGAERPAFLSSATFKVAHDAQGRPVLAIRSTDPFTEPLVDFLVDLRWRNGELVREYTLLLDPPGFASAPPAAPPAAEPTVESKTQTVARLEAPAVAQADTNAEPSVERSGRKITQIKVGPKATLRGIAWRIGERSPSDLQKMMIAIFRANPAAFDGNINRLYRGAVLTVPSEAQLAAITADEARREVHAQMTAWRESARPAGATAAIAAAPAATPPSAQTPLEAAAAASPLLTMTTAPGPADAAVMTPSGATAAASESPARALSPTDEALDRRVHQLEQELGEAKGVLESKNDQLLELQQKAARVEKPAPAEAPQVSQHRQEPSAGHRALAPTLTGLGILAAALAGLYFKLRRRKPVKAEAAVANDSLADTAVAGAEAAPRQPLSELQAQVPAAPQAPAWPAQEPVPRMAAPEPIARKIPDVSEEDIALERAIEAAAIYEATHPMLPLVAESAMPAAESKAPAAQELTAISATSFFPAQDSTVRLPPADAAPRSETANARMETKLDYNLVDLDMTVQHVHMPSVLNENPVIKERRTNLADVLKLALEREPNRHDLRMKLLELYFTQANTNRNGFLEVVQKLAEDRDFRQSPEWEKIAAMGRQIASDSPLFIDELVEDDGLSVEDDGLSAERKSA